MSQATAYDNIMAVIEQIVTAHTSYPLKVEIDNRTLVDLTQTDPYLKVEVKFLTAKQLDLGANPWTEQWGQIWISAVNKEGDGSLKLIQLLDFVAPYFSMKNLGLVQCRAVARGQGKALRGLYFQPAIVNFYYHDLT